MIIATPQSPFEKKADEKYDISLLCYHNNTNKAISVEQYSVGHCSEDRDLQLAIMASLSIPTLDNRSEKRKNPIEINDNDDCCAHSYCSDCMIKYVASKLQQNVTQSRCPVSECGGFLEPEHCHPIWPPEVFDRWGSALCEAAILGVGEILLPLQGCSAILINDDRENGDVITQLECPNCHRLCCEECKVAWHSDIECTDFKEDQREEEDIN
ncbi:E3 ubiquitin-protein ligase RSL1-like [Cornus florida]|uniref:E3 ubiquitin-protein ligase RSL1-like n=1 Tax=Cornus florida TaxID=4283 RepID=UPI00289AD657|nr:E3 ubiquitin-protein ligase RSL1-like [Cornus florida]